LLTWLTWLTPPPCGPPDRVIPRRTHSPPRPPLPLLPLTSVMLPPTRRLGLPHLPSLRADSGRVEKVQKRRREEGRQRVVRE
jgi:hypothetical protein